MTRYSFFCVFKETHALAYAGKCVYGEGRGGCRVASAYRGLVFTLISHRVSCGCQTLCRPPAVVLPLREPKSSHVFFLFILRLRRFSCPLRPPSANNNYTRKTFVTSNIHSFSTFILPTINKWFFLFYR